LKPSSPAFDSTSLLGTGPAASKSRKKSSSPSSDSSSSAESFASAVPTVLAAERMCGPRIIPCSPLLTEMVFQMGLGDCVVAVSEFWMPPPGVERPVVSSRAHVQTEAIVTLKPDILLVQQNVRDFDPIKQLLPDVRIEFFRIETLDDYGKAVARVAEIVGDKQFWSARRFHDALDAVEAGVAERPRKKVLFGGYYQVFSASAAGTFHDDMIRIAGGTNAASAGGYSGWNVRLTNEGVMALEPEVIVCQVAPGGEETARSFFASMPDVPAVRNKRVFFVTDPRWNVMSMHTTAQVKQLAEMIHGRQEGERIVAANERSVFTPMVILGIVSAALLVGGVVLRLLPRRRGVKG